MQFYTGILFDSSDLPLVAAPITIVISGSLSPAAVYDFGGIPISNPIVTDGVGQFAFRVANGVYDFLDANGLPLRREVQIFDLRDLMVNIGAVGRPIGQQMQQAPDGVRVVFFVAIALDTTVPIWMIRNGVLQDVVAGGPIGPSQVIITDNSITFSEPPQTGDSLLVIGWPKP